VIFCKYKVPSVLLKHEVLNSQSTFEEPFVTKLLNSHFDLRLRILLHSVERLFVQRTNIESIHPSFQGFVLNQYY
jgi:hypothetical protein